MSEAENTSVVLKAPIALRKLAGALGEIDSLRSFTNCLESTLSATGWLRDAEIQWKGANETADDFASSRFALPLGGERGIHGVLRTGVMSSGDTVGAADLHLMSALGAVIASAMDHAVRHGEMRRQLEMLAFMLDQAPVGLLAFDDRGAAVGNRLARRWLGGEEEGAVALVERLTPEVLGVDWREEESFHFRSQGCLLAGEVRTFEGAGDDGRVAHCLILTDLSAEQGRTLETLQRELYRAKWLKSRIDFVMLEMQAPFGAMPQRLDLIRDTLQREEFAGPYDAARIAVIMPGMHPGEARKRILKWVSLLPSEVKVAHVDATSDQAEEVIGQALGSMRPLDESTRSSLLLFDEYPAVNDMVDMVLGSSYRVVKCAHAEEAVNQLHSGIFDGFVTNWEGTEGRSAAEWALYAKKYQPSIKPFFTTITEHDQLPTTDPLLAQHWVIRKPFDVTELEQVVREGLAAAPQ